MRFRSFSRKRNINTLVTVTVTENTALNNAASTQNGLSVERGICPIATPTIIMAGCMAHARKGYISTSGVKSDVTIVFRDPNFS